MRFDQVLPEFVGVVDPLERFSKTESPGVAFGLVEHEVLARAIDTDRPRLHAKESRAGQADKRLRVNPAMAEATAVAPSAAPEVLQVGQE